MTFQSQSVTEQEVESSNKTSEDSSPKLEVVFESSNSGCHKTLQNSDTKDITRPKKIALSPKSQSEHKIRIMSESPNLKNFENMGVLDFDEKIVFGNFNDDEHF